MSRLSRRRFLGLLAAGGGAMAWGGCRPEPAPQPTVPGHIVNAGPPRGHMMRQVTGWSDFGRELPPCELAVVGGGISGLAAAWKLRRSGIDRLLLFDLEDALGGTSRSGERAGLVFPWGAHYIHIPPREADCIHEILSDLGIIEGYDREDAPIISSGALLRWPHERLFHRGRWTEGLLPFETSATGREEVYRFEDAMLRWTLYRGRDGRRAFAMPLHYSTADGKVRALDRISMADYMDGEGWHTPVLRWLVDHACRDDYGSRADQVSAWAGIHYYACRYYDYRVQDQYPSHTLTWSGGNGYLVAKLADYVGRDNIMANTLVAKAEVEGEWVRLGLLDLTNGDKVMLRVRALVYAGKLHTAPHVVVGMASEQAAAMRSISYSPWLVAAIFLKEPLAEYTTWDNVLYDSPSVGYVVADHQSDGSGRVLVYYWPFTDDLEASRRRLSREGHQYWVQHILADLHPAHPDIYDKVERIDLYRWGHGMPRPVPGSLWGAAAQLRRQPLERIFFASCDASGLPLCEEAVYSGIRAAEDALECIGHPCATSLAGLTHDA